MDWGVLFMPGDTSSKARLTRDQKILKEARQVEKTMHKAQRGMDRANTGSFSYRVHKKIYDKAANRLAHLQKETAR